MRLLARIDELEARTKRRSEPMPEPVPEWLKAKVYEEMTKDGMTRPPKIFVWRTPTYPTVIARLIWERGDAEPVDPLAEAFKEIGWSTESPRGYRPDRLRAALASRGLEIVKRGMELAKEIAP